MRGFRLDGANGSVGPIKVKAIHHLNKLSILRQLSESPLRWPRHTFGFGRKLWTDASGWVAGWGGS